MPVFVPVRSIADRQLDDTSRVLNLPLSAEPSTSIHAVAYLTNGGQESNAQSVDSASQENRNPSVHRPLDPFPLVTKFPTLSYKNNLPSTQGGNRLTRGPHARTHLVPWFLSATFFLVGHHLLHLVMRTFASKRRPASRTKLPHLCVSPFSKEFQTCHKFPPNSVRYRLP